MQALPWQQHWPTPTSHPRVHGWLEACGLLLLLAYVSRRLYKIFPAEGALNGDAYWTYLPNARKFLEHPWHFLTADPASYYVAPLGYLWPALWGADQIATQWANCGLFLLSLLFLYAFARQLGGPLAGFLALALMGSHPDIKDSATQVLTESIYLFGFCLSLFAMGRAVASDPQKRCKWLACLSAGLCITLLSRPVLQYMTLLVLVLLPGIAIWFRGHRQAAKQTAVALLAALLLPLAFGIKNGVCFDVWGISSGSGSGLLYGLSPLKNGAEPVYSNFSYDADVIPLAVAPETQGHPLLSRSDALNKAAALEFVRQTSLPDNLGFLSQKLHMWLFTATPELYINARLRLLRLSEWSLIGLAAILLALSWRKRRATQVLPLQLPGAGLNTRNKLLICTGLLLGLLTMAAQLTPVLYNTRYASYFIEPWLIVLTSVAVAYLFSGNFFMHRRHSRWLMAAACIASTLLVANALTQHALRHEIWEVDASRPGPSTVLLSASQLQQVHAEGMHQNEQGEWIIEQQPAVLRIPLGQVNLPTHEQMRDAFWRLRFSFQASTRKMPAACGKALLTVSPHQETVNWHVPPPIVFVRNDGQAHTHVMSANGSQRPQGQAELLLSFDCPAHSKLVWHGVELRRSTLTDAAIEFLRTGAPIDMYLHSDIP